MYVLDGQQSTMKAMGWVRNQSVHNFNSDIPPQDLNTHKAHFSGIDKRFSCEPLPHECTSRIVIHGVDESTYVVVH